jgi:hypothetical protein
MRRAAVSTPNTMVPRVERADTVAICAGCPVREPCLAAALKDPNLVGVVGRAHNEGMTRAPR